MSRKQLAIILASLLLLAALLLTGCQKGGTETTSAESTTAEPAQTDEVTTAPDDGKLVLIKDGIPNVVVIRRDRGTSSDADVHNAVNIRTKLEGYCEKGTTTGLINTDWSKDGTHDADALEILVGCTNYPESVEVANSLKFGDYAVKVIGKKIVVMGFTDSAISRASTALTNKLKELAVKDDNGKTTIAVTPEDLEASGTVNAVISNLPSYENGTFSAWYDAGDNCDEIIIEKTTEDAFNAYLTKLNAAGFKDHASHTIKDNIFRTLYTSEYTVNIGYFGYDKTVRLIIEPFSQASLFGSEADNKYTAVTTSQITMIGLEYQKSDGGYASNGMSILIRLTDGRFIVIDGGFNRAKCMDLLIDQLKKQSADYVAKTGGIKIAGWIITHAHGDHSGLFNGTQYQRLKSSNIKLERFIINFMSDSERNKAINYYLSQGSSNWSSSEGSAWTKVYDAAAVLDADVVVTHVGHVYHIADLQLETLYTIENYAPAVAQAFNTTSLIMKMTFTEAATGKQTVYMSTGDATGPAFLSSSKYYGDYLKADIVQVAHHGYTTWGTSEGTIAAYKKMAPPTVLWPQGIQAYPSYVTKDYNKVLVNTTDNPNYKETLVAGSEGTITVFPIPYTVGSAIVTKP